MLTKNEILGITDVLLLCTVAVTAVAPIRQKRFYCTVLLEQTSFFEVSYAIFYRALPCERFIGACGSLNVLNYAVKLTCQSHPSHDLPSAGKKQSPFVSPGLEL